MPSTPSPRRTAALLAVVCLATVPSTAIARAADAAPAQPRVSVSASDTDVRSGEQLVLTGRLTRAGQGLPGDVQVWSRTGGGWYELSGAEVHTNRTGVYRVRVVLSSTGERELKVVADPDRAGLRDASAVTRVRVR